VGPGDYLLLQNETTLVREAAEFARANGCFVVYSAAPFDPVAAAAMRPHVDLIAMNAVEARQMSEALGTAVDEISVLNLVVTEGSDGATWYGSETIRQAAFRVDPVDTTGAGDCFIGSLVAGLDQGMSAAKALRFAAAAAAVQVTRHGAARAMPRLEEIERFLSAQ
jgi:ribokinase